MKILVTGHNGLLGSACVRRLGIRHEIITYNGNILDSSLFNTWLKWHKPDAIVHCAARVGGVKANRDEPVQFISDNLKLQEAVIGEAHRLGINNLVFVATSCLFPKDAPVPVKESSLLTGPFESSVQAYAIAKLAGWALCKAYSEQYGRNYMTVCPSNLYGPKDNYGPSAHVIPALIKRMHAAMKLEEDLVVWGDGSAVREFLYVDDAADAIGVVLEKWNRPDPINLGSGVSTTIRELVKKLSDTLQFKGDVTWDVSQPTGIPRKTFDISNLTSLGWKPRWTLEDGLKNTVFDFLTKPLRCK